MINIVSNLDKANKQVVEKISKLSEVILEFQSELAVSRQVNSIVLNRLTSVACQYWANAQYSRRECLDMTGIPGEVDADVLKEKLLKNFGELGCDIPPERTEACHRIR